MIKRILIVSTQLSILLSMTACFKTAEEIKREKQIDDQLNQSSKIIAGLTHELNDLKGNVATTSGKIEEYDHKQNTSSQEREENLNQTITQLSEQVKILTQQSTDNKALLVSMQKEMARQKKYIKNLTGTLTTITGPTKSSSNNKLSTAHKHFEKNRLTKAKKLYNEVLDEKKVNAAQRNHILNNLGLINYWQKKYDTALIHFSKIYTKYPKSSWGPKALLYIARSFSKSNRKVEANASYQELINNYPKTKHAKKAKKEMK